jgi:hypothetical protein
MEYVRKYSTKVQKYKNIIENIKVHEINEDYWWRTMWYTSGM